MPSSSSDPGSARPRVVGWHVAELAKTEDGEESFVDAPLLFGANMTDEFA